MIKISNLNCSFGEKQVLSNINLNIQKGEILNLLGANGSGKTTLLRCILGLENYKGEIFIKKQKNKNLTPKTRAKLLSYVPQSNYVSFNFSALDIVLMGRFASSLYKYSQEDLQKALLACERVGISNLNKEIFRKLSGGQKQLVLVARALASEAEIILLDEPINGLDLKNQMLLLRLIEKLANEGYTIVCTTHYPEHAFMTATKIAWLDSGKLIALGEPKDVLTNERIYDIYGVKSEFVLDSKGSKHIITLKESV